MFTRTFEGEWLPRVGCRATCLQKKIVRFLLISGSASSAVWHTRTLLCFQERRCCAGFFGEHCEACPGPKGRPCFDNGVCVDGTNGTGVCRCNEGFNGTACETCQSGKYGVHCDQGSVRFISQHMICHLHPHLHRHVLSAQSANARTDSVTRD